MGKIMGKNRNDKDHGRQTRIPCRGVRFVRAGLDTEEEDYCRIYTVEENEILKENTLRPHPKGITDELSSNHSQISDKPSKGKFLLNHQTLTHHVVGFVRAGIVTEEDHCHLYTNDETKILKEKTPAPYKMGRPRPNTDESTNNPSPSEVSRSQLKGTNQTPGNGYGDTFNIINFGKGGTEPSPSNDGPKPLDDYSSQFNEKKQKLGNGSGNTYNVINFGSTGNKINGIGTYEQNEQMSLEPQRNKITNTPEEDSTYSGKNHENSIKLNVVEGVYAPNMQVSGPVAMGRDDVTLNTSSSTTSTSKLSDSQNSSKPSHFFTTEHEDITTEDFSQSKMKKQESDDSYIDSISSENNHGYNSVKLNYVEGVYAPNMKVSGPVAMGRNDVTVNTDVSVNTSGSDSQLSDSQNNSEPSQSYTTKDSITEGELSFSNTVAKSVDILSRFQIPKDDPFNETVQTGMVEAYKTKITKLELKDSEISDMECEAIAEELKTNSALTKLDLHGCSVTHKGWKTIDEALDTNKALKDLNLIELKLITDGENFR